MLPIFVEQRECNDNKRLNNQFKEQGNISCKHVKRDYFFLVSVFINAVNSAKTQTNMISHVKSKDSINWD